MNITNKLAILITFYNKKFFISLLIKIPKNPKNIKKNHKNKRTLIYCFFSLPLGKVISVAHLESLWEKAISSSLNKRFFQSS